MATELTVQTTAAAGIVLSTATAADATGNFFTNSGREFIEITNASVGTITVTFVTAGTYNVGATTYPISDLAVTVSPSTTKGCGPFDRALFSDANNRVNITYSGVTSLSVKVIGLGTA